MTAMTHAEWLALLQNGEPSTYTGDKEITGSLTVGAGESLISDGQSLVSLQTYDEGGDFPAIRFGDVNGPIGAEMVFDWAYGNGLYLFDGVGIVLTEASDYSDPSAARSQYRRIYLQPSSLLMAAAPADEGGATLPPLLQMTGSYFPTSGARTTRTFQLGMNLDPESGYAEAKLSLGLASLVVASDGAITAGQDNMTLGRVDLPWETAYLKLPTVDPAIAGVLWNNAGTPAISAGA